LKVLSDTSAPESDSQGHASFHLVLELLPSSPLRCHQYRYYWDAVDDFEDSGTLVAPRFEIAWPQDGKKAAKSPRRIRNRATRAHQHLKLLIENKKKLVFVI
jgi:hypothetical protein